MRKKKVTLQDIADKVGISSASVSMILASKSLNRFSDETINAVYTVSRQLGYECKHSKEDRKVVIIVCPSVINPYFASIIQGMEQEAKVRGLGTMLFTTYWDLDKEKRICEFAKEPSVGGVIFAMIPQQPELVRELNKTVPVVAVGDKQNDIGLDTVDVNNFNAGILVANHLLSLGHRRIAYLSTSLNSEHSARVRRFEGLKAAIKQFGQTAKLSLYTAEVSSLTELNTLDIEHQTGYALAKRCMKETPDVTAMVAINDMVAYGVIDAIKESGASIPEDYSVCGFDNIYPSSFAGVGLTTVEHYILQGGKSAVRLLCEKMDRQQPRTLEQGAVTRVEYQNRLVVRTSTGTPPVK
ncbi:HTH-type transcriptional regulator DegA [bioreactor metagenome]|jgi:LacI family transcriptional regulator|uniref:Substrate-binding domain-containing protein n=2 Tax=root TaxID=1 RepID=A0ABY4DCW9_9SPIR|nr:LacI family DNA-binding transcriptional regulator [Sphaerochaeta associata]MDT3359440.1 substrate-binding domain-containing protein [Spirochaetota bacterium]UOM51971.1 substrate-binding domain-containing protein [Sphaerochaeta associata]SMP58146.1 transcriptional regulator, LacI family [Sphaerochaeta associata]